MKESKQPKKRDPETTTAIDPWGMKGKFKKAGGSQSDAWNHMLLEQAGRTIWRRQSDPEKTDQQVYAVLQGMVGIKPQDELEGMMAAQLIAAHNAGMECFRRAMLGEQSFDGRRENLNQANKLSRTFATLLEALNRHRGKGQQKVTVEHVHVHSGGQAVVGVVESPGGGARQKPEEQAHAKTIAHAPESALRSPNPAREAVPIPSDAERQVPDARRKVSRGSQG